MATLVAVVAAACAALVTASVIVVVSQFAERPPPEIETARQFWLDYMLPTRLAPGLLLIAPVALVAGLVTSRRLARPVGDAPARS